MKKVFSNKYVIAGLIIIAAGSVVYLTTWGNKKWLINQIEEKGGNPPGADGNAADLSTLPVRDLQKKLSALS